MTNGLYTQTVIPAPQLREAARRLDAEKDDAPTQSAHTAAIRQSLTVRGDPFAQHDCLRLADESQSIEIPIADLPVVIGAGQQADYVTPGTGVSRKHIRLSKEGAFVKIEDMQSKNGTFLNTRRIQADYLCEGDRLTIGALQFLIERR